VLVTRIGDAAARDLTGHERAVELHAKPLAEFVVVGQRRHTRDGDALSSMRFSIRSVTDTSSFDCRSYATIGLLVHMATADE
jgi:hypothetical protein